MLTITYLFQSDRIDNNVHVFNYPWSPVPQKSIITVAFFQCIDSFYSQTEDWFFSHNDVFGDADNVEHMETVDYNRLRQLGVDQMAMNAIRDLFG